MKKIITLLLCLCIFLLPAAVALADNENLAGTTWELGLILDLETDEMFDMDYIEENDMMITFRFGENGDVTLTYPGNAFHGIYLLSGDYLEIDFQNGISIHTAIVEGAYGVLMFSFINTLVEGLIHIFVLTEGTFGGAAPAATEPEPAPATSAPATPEPRPTPAPAEVESTPDPEQPETPAVSPSPSSPSGDGMPRILRDALVGGAIGAVAGGVVWLIRRKKKKPATAQAMPHGVNPMHPGQYPPMAAPPQMAPASATMAPHSAQRQLYCQSGPMAGATFPVNGTLRIGRDPKQCQIIFPADAGGISSLHCEIQQQASGVLLVDCGSTYGTFLLNGRKLNANESVALNPGDGFYLAGNQNSFKVL